MALAGGRRRDEAEGGYAGERATGGDQEVTSRKFKGFLSLSSGHRRSPSLKPMRPSTVRQDRSEPLDEHPVLAETPPAILHRVEITPRHACRLPLLSFKHSLPPT